MLSKYGRMRWLLFTVVFGMVPILFRVIFYVFNKDTGNLQLFTASDFISLGIVLQVSVFNEVKYTKEDDAEWRQLFVGCTALFFALFSVFYCLTLTSELGRRVDLDLILKVSAGLDIVLILLYLAVYGRIQAASVHAQKREVQ